MVKSSIAKYRTKCGTTPSDVAKQIVENGVSTLKSYDQLLESKYPYGPKEVSKLLTAEIIDPTSPNEILESLVTPTIDAISDCVSQISKLESFIGLSTPQMEDGNNFGVSVQLVVAKFLKESREKLEKQIDVTDYYTKRADAVDKLGLSKSTFAKTTTNTSSNSTGGKDGDEKKTNQSNVEESKTTGSSAKPDYFRLKAISAIDTAFYCAMRSTVVEMIDIYSCVIDNVEKNFERLSQPKGSGGGGTNMSMY
eukprot:CAMPEP_0194357528 /NCGR_PEP_ID=MMETSP0174-20130528/5005_1 /TAXON_ID=216777 /ORGANISM="Proboscia alata, Strain PI-D3" /LENGTH=251 /DNA_ID=CAMNT_0039127603 /DNA_START=100 /DNA_END=855 /DNA_ORIENTATION=-